MEKRKVYDLARLFALAAAATALLVGYRGLDARRQELERLERSIIHYRDLTAEERRRDAGLRERLAQLRGAVDAIAPFSEEAAEGAVELDAWMTRVRNLKSFLRRNRKLRIPEMRYLEPADWLLATADGALIFESDYRRSAAILRMQAKLHVASKMREAVLEFADQVGEGADADWASLASFLMNEMDPAIVSRYAVAPEGETFNGQRVVLMEEPVDPFWEHRFTFTEGGIFVAGGIRRHVERDIADAITAYRNENGTAPGSSADIVRYLNHRKSLDALDEVFGAMTRKTE